MHSVRVVLHMISGEKIASFTDWDEMQRMIEEENAYMMVEVLKNGTVTEHGWRCIRKSLVESYEIY